MNSNSGTAIGESGTISGGGTDLGDGGDVQVGSSTNTGNAAFVLQTTNDVWTAGIDSTDTADARPYKIARGGSISQNERLEIAPNGQLTAPFYGSGAAGAGNVNDVLTIGTNGVITGTTIAGVNPSLQIAYDNGRNVTVTAGGDVRLRSSTTTASDVLVVTDNADTKTFGVQGTGAVTCASVNASGTVNCTSVTTTGNSSFGGSTSHTDSINIDSQNGPTLQTNLLTVPSGGNSTIADVQMQANGTEIVGIEAKTGDNWNPPGSRGGKLQFNTRTDVGSAALTTKLQINSAGDTEIADDQVLQLGPVSATVKQRTRNDQLTGSVYYDRENYSIGAYTTGTKQLTSGAIPRAAFTAQNQGSPWAAYTLRKLSPVFSPNFNVVRVRFGISPTTQHSEQDLGFDPVTNMLDERKFNEGCRAAGAALGGVGRGFIRTWYTQGYVSGNHFQQSTNFLQPEILFEDGIPTVRFFESTLGTASTRSYMDQVGQFPNTTNCYVHGIIKCPDATAGIRFVLGNTTLAGDQELAFGHTTDNEAQVWGVATSSVVNDIQLTNSYRNGNSHTFQCGWTSTGVDWRYDSVATAPGGFTYTGSADYRFTTQRNFRLGARSSPVSFGLGRDSTFLPELLFYDNNPNPNVSVLEAEQMKIWGQTNLEIPTFTSSQNGQFMIEVPTTSLNVTFSKPQALKISAGTTPTTTTFEGEVGEVRYGTHLGKVYLYIKTSATNWSRVEIKTW